MHAYTVNTFRICSFVLIKEIMFKFYLVKRKTTLEQMVSHLCHPSNFSSPGKRVRKKNSYIAFLSNIISETLLHASRMSNRSYYKYPHIHLIHSYFPQFFERSDSYKEDSCKKGCLNSMSELFDPIQIL